MIESNKKDIILILDNIRSALNVGAIIRSADGAGVKEVYICGITPNVTHPKVVKTALGAEDFVNTRYFKSTEDAITFANDLGYPIFGIEQSSESKPIQEIKDLQKLCLIFGNELTGVSPAILSLCDDVIEIPMLGKKNSLNVATTLGIVIYYLILQ